MASTGNDISSVQTNGHSTGNEYLSLDVAIVGGGIAGLTTAIALRKAGHKVTVYESSHFANEIGAAIHMAPNATAILTQFGFDVVGAGCVPNGISASWDADTMAPRTRKTLYHMRETYGNPWYLSHRVDMHSELKRLAFQTAGEGIPATLRTGSKVVSVDCDKPSLTLADGTVVEPDLIIGADGVHSRVINEITGKVNKALPTGFSAYRFLIPVKNLMEDPKTRWLVDKDEVHVCLFILGELRLAVYPCRNREMMNYVAIHEQAPSDNSKEEWNVTGNKERLMETFQSFNPCLLAVFEHCQDLDDLKVWPLLYRAPIEHWTRGKVCAIGDAVHPMLPHQAQGGAQSIEDGAALGVLLSKIKSKSEIQARFEAFQEVRFNRASAVQILSNKGHDVATSLKDELRPYVGETPLNTQADHHQFLFSYSVKEHAEQKLAELVRGKEI